MAKKYFIKTERLTLRNFLPTDLNDFYEYAKVKGVGEWAGWIPHKNIEESKKILDMFLKNPNCYAIVNNKNNKVIGSFEITKEVRNFIPKSKRSFELGYVLSKKYWGRGYMSEIVRNACRYIFSKTETEYIYICAFQENQRSQNVALKTGFEFSGIVSGNFASKDNITSNIYELSKEKYKKISRVLPQKEIPLQEFDTEKDAIINPYFFSLKYDKLPSKLVMTFFHDVIDELLFEKKIDILYTLYGENNLVIYKYVDEDIIIIHAPLGSSASGGFLEELISLGVKDVCFCGGAGSLIKGHKVGDFVLVKSAIRDEGLSYHYLKPSREVKLNTPFVKKFESYIKNKGIPYRAGKTWTTDAFYRETFAKRNLRVKEGACIVEMEQAALIAVSKFRHINYAAIIYCGDDVSKESYDTRSWRKRDDIRRDMCDLCHDFLKELKRDV